MNHEKPTMAAMSGKKRDRRSDHTDKLPTPPNTKDNKLLCADDRVAIGRKQVKELVQCEGKEQGTGDRDDGTIIFYDASTAKTDTSEYSNPTEGLEESLVTLLWLDKLKHVRRPSTQP
jgi:hypothetical protein